MPVTRSYNAPNPRKFGGKEYKILEAARNKKLAQHTAGDLRKKGYLVLVVNYDDQHYHYLIYFRKKGEIMGRRITKNTVFTWKVNYTLPAAYAKKEKLKIKQSRQVKAVSLFAAVEKFKQEVKDYKSIEDVELIR